MRVNKSEAYDVILDAQMFLPQVAENKRTDPGQNQLALDFGDPGSCK